MSKGILTMLAWVMCIGAVWGFRFQRQQLVGLRAQQAGATGDALQPTQTSGENQEPRSATLAPSTDSADLLRLRSEVTRLTARKRELSGVQQENERLHGQLASQPDSAGSNRLPAGYQRKAQAQLVGYSTPENTIQSFLWAIQHHDVTNLLQALVPAAAQNVSLGLASPGGVEDFFKNTDPMPGLAIQGRQDLPDGSVEMQVYFGPGIPQQKLRSHLIDGQWKLEFPF